MGKRGGADAYMHSKAPRPLKYKFVGNVHYETEQNKSRKCTFTVARVALQKRPVMRARVVTEHAHVGGVATARQTLQNGAKMNV